MHNIYYVLLYMTIKIPDFLQEAHIKEIKDVLGVTFKVLILEYLTLLRHLEKYRYSIPQRIKMTQHQVNKLLDFYRKINIKKRLWRKKKKITAGSLKRLQIFRIDSSDNGTEPLIL